MTEYNVTWSIDLDANGPVSAAREALDLLLGDPHTTATVFEVIDLEAEHEEVQIVDLSEISQ
jgi:hypothetical protein